MYLIPAPVISGCSTATLFGARNNSVDAECMVIVAAATNIVCVTHGNHFHSQTALQFSSLVWAVYSSERAIQLEVEDLNVCCMQPVWVVCRTVSANSYFPLSIGWRRLQRGGNWCRLYMKFMYFFARCLLWRKYGKCSKNLLYKVKLLLSQIFIFLRDQPRPTLSNNFNTPSRASTVLYNASTAVCSTWQKSRVERSLPPTPNTAHSERSVKMNHFTFNSSN